MSRTSFRVNPHSIFAWMSRNSLLETSKICTLEKKRKVRGFHMFSAGTEKGAFVWDWLSEYLNILHIETLTATYQFLFNFYQFTKDPRKSSKWSSFSKTCFKVEFTFEFLLNFQERAPFENKGCLIECYTIIFGFFDTQTQSRNILYLRLIEKLDLRGFQFLKGSENEF